MAGRGTRTEKWGMGNVHGRRQVPFDILGGRQRTRSMKCVGAFGGIQGLSGLWQHRAFWVERPGLTAARTMPRWPLENDAGE